MSFQFGGGGGGEKNKLSLGKMFKVARKTNSMPSETIQMFGCRSRYYHCN